MTVTKYEWEHELKKNIHRLPSDEVARVLDYYNEMFEDYIERGKSEREIIREFGNPADVADKILSEYDGELLPDDGHVATPFDPPTVPPPPPPPKKRAPEKAEKDAYDGIFEGYEDNKPGEFIEIGETKAKKPERSRPSEPNEYERLSEVDKRNFKVAIFIVFNILTGFAFFIVSGVLWIVLAAFAVAGAGIAVGGAYAFVVSFGPMFGGAFGSGLAQLGIGVAMIGLGAVITVLSIYVIKLYATLTKKLFNLIFVVNKKERA